MRTAAFRLSLLLIFVIPWENAFAIDGLGSIARIAGLLAAGVWVVTVINSGTFRKLHQFHIAAILFVGWNTLSFFWSADPQLTATRALTYLQLLILAFLIWDLFRDQAAIQKGMQAYVLGCYVSIVGVLMNYLRGDAYTQDYTADRFSGAGLDPNELGVILAVGLPLAWSLFSSYRTAKGSSRLMGLINAAYVPVAVVAVLLTGSRTATVAVLLAVTYVLFTLAGARAKGVITILAAVVIVGLAVPFLPDATLDRILSTSNAFAEGELSGRVQLWNESWQVFLGHPLAGVGSSAFRSGFGLVPHNVLLGVLAETGLIGLGLFSLILSLTARSATRQPSDKARLWLFVLAIWFVGAMSMSLEASKITWLILALVRASEWATPESETLRRSGRAAVISQDTLTPRLLSSET